MSKKLIINLTVLAAAAVAVMGTGAVSAHDVGGGSNGRGGFGGGIHYDHIVVRGGHDGGGWGHGGYGRGADRSGDGSSAGRSSRAGKAAAGNSGVYCQFCVGQRTPAPDPSEDHKG